MSKQINKVYGAGRWFPADPCELRSQLDSYLQPFTQPTVNGKVVGGIAPHAGYMYSGEIAGKVFSSLSQQNHPHPLETLILLGFNHAKLFEGAAIMPGTAISTPLGQTRLDSDAGELLKQSSDKIFFDRHPHAGEHSVENLVPFAQAALPKAKLLLIMLGDHRAETRSALTAGLSQLANSLNIAVIASSDMLHDSNYDLVLKTDHNTLKHVAAMQTQKLLETWQPSFQIFCGIAGVVTAMEFAAGQGCRRGTVLDYQTSADAQPASRGNWIVGYGAVVFTIN